MQHNNNSYESLLIKLLEASMIEKGTQTVRLKLAILSPAKDICREKGYTLNDYVNTAVAEKIARELSKT